jgi:SAM-dependent methyltransferase
VLKALDMKRPILILALLSACLPQATPRYEFRSQHDPNGIGKFYMGREIARVMDHGAIPWLERPQREAEERPKRVIEALALAPDMTVADVGAGSGYYTFRLAPLVRKVIAVDIQKEMLDFIKDKAEKLGSPNVEPVLGTIEDPKLPAGAVDLALLADVYHEFSHPHEMMTAIARSLKTGGRVALVEFRAEDPNVPIKAVHKMSEAQARREMEAVGLRWERTVGTLPWQHILLFSTRR